ncbi:hypothetical protein RvY_09284-2 [Ramazzottius varieornatus]|uniref:Uncharacterized protein n=1 Tax=Ramazzottius varieornatus TaxID=947166 RepID=A0A1D1VBA4_RAMVA|nr:hypothetical protein RvY_09284-2 [Ramazzottius varieornatus]
MHHQQGQSHYAAQPVRHRHNPQQNSGLQFIPPNLLGSQSRPPSFPQHMPSRSSSQTNAPWVNHIGFMGLPSSFLGLPSDQQRQHPHFNFHMLANRPQLNHQQPAPTGHNFPRFASVRPSIGIDSSFAGLRRQENHIQNSGFGSSAQQHYSSTETQEAPMDNGYEDELDGVPIDSWPHEPRQWESAEGECTNSLGQQNTEPDILRFGDRMPAQDGTVNKEQEHSVWNVFSESRNEVSHFPPHQPNIRGEKRPENRQASSSSAEHIHHAVEKAAQQVAHRRSNKENVHSPRKEEPRKKYSYEKPRKDENRPDADKDLRKPLFREKDTLGHLLTKVRENEDVHRRSRRSPSLRGHRRPTRNSSREYDSRGRSYSRRDRLLDRNADKPFNAYKTSWSHRNTNSKTDRKREDARGASGRRSMHEDGVPAPKDTKPKQPQHSKSAAKTALRKMSDASSLKGSEEGEIISIMSTTESVSRESSTPYSPPGCLPGEEDQIVDVADITSPTKLKKKNAQKFKIRPSPPFIDLTTPLSPEEVSTLEEKVPLTETATITNTNPDETSGLIREVGRSFSTTDYDKIDLGAPLSPDADYSVLYSPSTAPILLGDPDSPDPSEAGDEPFFGTGDDYHTLYTEKVLPFGNEVAVNTFDFNVDDELEAALEASRDENPQGVEEDGENEEVVSVQDETEVVMKNEEGMVPSEPEIPDVEEEEQEEVGEQQGEQEQEEAWPSDEEPDDDDFDLPFFPFDVTLHANEGGASDRVMFESEDVLRARAVAALGTQFRVKQPDDSDVPPPNPAKDVLWVETVTSKDNAGRNTESSASTNPFAFVSFNFQSLLPPASRAPESNPPLVVTAQSPPRSSFSVESAQSPVKIKQESPIAIIPLSPSPCREAASTSSATESRPLVRTSGSSSSLSTAGDKMSENSAQQSFFRRMMSQAENTTQITFEASKPRSIKSPARVAEQKKAHRIAKFGPVGPLMFQIQPKEPASDEPDAPVAPPTKFTTRESFLQASGQSAKGKMVVPMPTPRSVRTASKKGSTRKKRKRLRATGAAPVVIVPKPSASSAASVIVVLPERRTIPSLHVLTDHHQSSTAPREAYNQLDALECSLEEAYWNDIEIIDKIRKLEEELKVAHRRKMKSDNRIGSLHELVSWPIVVTAFLLRT